MNEQDARKVVEAVLFSSADVLSSKHLATVLGNSTPARIRELVQALNAEYESTGRAFRITAVGDGFQFRTLPMYKTWVAKSEPLKPVKLSPPALETLAIVAYRQPVTRAELEHLRGVDCSSPLRRLLELRLVRMLGKDKSPGRPILYGTSKDFLSLFNLSDLRDLPTLEDFDLKVQEAPITAPTSPFAGSAELMEASQAVEPTVVAAGPAPEEEAEEPLLAAGGEAG